MSKAHIELWKTGPSMTKTINIGWTKDEYQRYRSKKKSKKKQAKKLQNPDVDKLKKLLELCDFLQEEGTVSKHQVMTRFDMKYNQVTNLLVTAENIGLLIWEGYNEIGQLNAAEFKKKWQNLVV